MHRHVRPDLPCRCDSASPATLRRTARIRATCTSTGSPATTVRLQADVPQLLGALHVVAVAGPGPVRFAVVLPVRAGLRVSRSTTASVVPSRSGAASFGSAGGARRPTPRPGPSAPRRRRSRPSHARLPPPSTVHATGRQHHVPQAGRSTTWRAGPSTMTTHSRGSASRSSSCSSTDSVARTGRRTSSRVAARAARRVTDAGRSDSAGVRGTPVRRSHDRRSTPRDETQHSHPVSIAPTGSLAAASMIHCSTVLSAVTGTCSPWLVRRHRGPPAASGVGPASLPMRAGAVRPKTGGRRGYQGSMQMPCPGAHRANAGTRRPVEELPTALGWGTRSGPQPAGRADLVPHHTRLGNQSGVDSPAEAVLVPHERREGPRRRAARLSPARRGSGRRPA